MRRLAALALVACSSPARAPEPQRPTPKPADASPVAAPESAPVPTLHTKRDAREAPHGGTIVTLALSPDASAVLSADELGGVRLWPALDGSIEPRVVDMPIARQLAVNHFDKGYSAVALDEAGGLYIAKLDETGRQVSHTTLSAEPAVTGMAMTSLGLLAWRADQTVVLLDADGATKDKLGTEPQQRLIAMAVSGKRAVAVIESEGTKRQARWLTLEPKLAWGPSIALMTEFAGDIDIALSPNAKRLAQLSRPIPSDPPKSVAASTTSLAVFELTKGKTAVPPIATVPAVATSADVGFADDDHVATGGLTGVAWVDLTTPNGKSLPGNPMSSGSRTQPALATGGGRAITPMNGDLVITKPDNTQQFLGYDTVSPRIAEVGPAGQLLIGVGDHLLLLDKDLRASESPIGGVTGTLAELRWVGEDDWLLESSSPTDGTLQITLVGPHTPTTVVRKALKETQILGYEPSTQHVTLSFGAESEVAKLDRKGHKLDRLSGVKKTSPYEQVLFVPQAPSLARSTQLLQITMKDKSTIKWLRDASALDKPSATVTVEGPFAGADAAGHVFMWRNTPTGQLELVLYADGKAVRTLPNTGAIALWPEPNGKRYVEVAQSSVSLYDIDGKQLWFQQLATSQEALWLTDGTIAITSAGGIARLDPATGAVTAARCGWRFGLASKPHPATPRVEPLCSQLRR